MIPARWPRPEPLREKLLHVDPRRGTLRDAHVDDLPALLRARDLLVVNDAATLPGSLHGRAGDAAVELRLVAELPSGAFTAVLFGAGDWRTATEHRAPPPVLPAGSLLRFGDLAAVVERVSPISRRLVEVRFDSAGAALWAALYRLGRPIQYAYAAAPLELWHVQLSYASRPWAAEMPSAGRTLRWELLLRLRARGIRIAFLTHAAGLSSTGDPSLDAALPLAERYEIPAATVAAVAQAKAEGSRVVAIGTSAVRALEGSAAGHGGRLSAGAGETDLLLGPGYRPRVVDGLLTGIHDTGASHFALLHAFSPADLLQRASAHAESAGYLAHEFGDSCLVLAS